MKADESRSGSSEADAIMTSIEAALEYSGEAAAPPNELTVD
jgi:hypothetical protein